VAKPPRIELTRTLNEGIYRSVREAYDGVVATFPLTKRGVVKASRVYNETRERDVRSWGTIGAGSLRLTIGGHDVTHALEYTYLDDGKLAEIIARRLSTEAAAREGEVTE
jgi:hypothetical protein